MPLPQRSEPFVRRKPAFLAQGFQWRFAALVAGSLTVLLLFTGLHGLFVAKLILPQEIAQQIQPMFAASTLRLFVVGVIYIAVVTLAAAFLSHKAVGPVGRLEDDLRRLVGSPEPPGGLTVREGTVLRELSTL